jgi:hypothetical protein
MNGDALPKYWATSRTSLTNVNEMPSDIGNAGDDQESVGSFCEASQRNDEPAASKQRARGTLSRAENRKPAKQTFGGAKWRTAGHNSAGTASRADSNLEAVGAINRAKDTEG